MRIVVIATLAVAFCISGNVIVAQDVQSDTPPAPSKKALGPLRVSSGVAVGNIIFKINPAYPAEAKKDHITGTVILRALISKQGDIIHLQVIASPDPSLTEASITAVQQWKYRPYLLNGEPTEVDTQITVNFTQGK